MKKVSLLIIVSLFIIYAKSQNYNNIVNYHINGTPVHGTKIKTNLPFINSNHMPMVKIEGYGYNEPSIINLALSWYIFNNQFTKMTISSAGGVAPDAWLSNENGKVVIYLNMKIYFQRFTISAFAQGMSEKPEYFTGWTVVDEALSGTHQTHVPYSNSSSVTIGKQISPEPGSINRLTIVPYRHTGGPWQFISRDAPTDAYLDFNYGVNKIMTFAHKHKVGILTQNPTCALDVNGTIRAKEVKIEATGWADFVFDNDYKLSCLSEVEQHIKEHKHLPGIPSEQEVLENGINVAEMQIKLLQKIEELTLYVINQQKEIESLKEENIRMNNLLINSKK